MKDRIAKWYSMGLWTDEMVRDAVTRFILSIEDYTEITGKEYK